MQNNQELIKRLNKIAESGMLANVNSAVVKIAADRIGALAAPWTHINPADPGTLPPRFTGIFVATRNGNVDTVIGGYYDDLGKVFVESKTMHIIPGVVYAYLNPLDVDPPPYPGTAENQEGEER